jgi:phosphoribosylglycinamide formyltransferase-1
MPKINLGVLASGRGSNLQAILDATAAGKLDARVVVVISDKKEAQALERARLHHISTVHLSPKDYSSRESYDQAIVKILQEYAVDLVVLAGYMRIITPDLIHAYRNRVMNIHPSLLPAFPGLHAQRQALDHGVKVTGATVHFVDEQVDHGPIIIQTTVPVLATDTEETLSARILEQEHRIYPLAIQWFAEGRLKIIGRRVMIEAGEDPRGGGG